MSQQLPIDLCSLVKEPEAHTRARHETVEWGEAPDAPVQHDDYLLDDGFEPYEPQFGRVDRFTDSYEDLSVHVTLIEDGVLFGQEFLVCDRQVPTVSTMRLYLANMTKLQAGRDAYVPREIPADSDTVYLVGASAPHKAFYHWVFQSLPAIAVLRDEALRRGRDYRIVLPPLDGVKRESLSMLGISEEECLTLEPHQYLAGVPLLYTNACYGDFAFQPSRKLMQALQPFRDACLARASRDLPRRFYLSRRDAPLKRPLENSEELRLALRAKGYQEVVVSTLSLADQVALFARAESIVAPHGAGLVNLMFASPTLRLLEIVPKHYRHSCFFRLAQARRVAYSMVLADMAREDPKDPRHGSVLRVDIGKVLTMLGRREQLFEPLADAVNGSAC